MEFRTRTVMLVGAMLIVTILILYSLAYANQGTICEIYPANPLVESWLQGIARTLK